MKLIDLLSVTSEVTNVNVYNLDGDLLTFYDGKNSIDEEYNDIEVFEINVNNNDLEVIIRIEA